MSKAKKKTAKKGGSDPFEKEIEALEAVEDEDGIPKNAVVFTVQFEIEHIDIEDYKIQMNFIDKSDPEQLQKIEIPLIQNWDEKEEEIEGEEQDPSKKSKKKEKSKAKAKKGKSKGKD